ncbi:unnamed protein product [Blepharisma stoltei]|uniref:Uncharacterized protein n=1 Tax=Blepharisma stoltei TaxID=1481888 RepID=A0AAU9J738_9CILI|nr:unnamed protein product [Blepharisma stoltei]
MVGGMIGGKVHNRVNWKWRTLLNLCAYSVKDPTTLTEAQRFSRIYRSCLRRLWLLNCCRLRWATANHKNYFEHIERVRKEFEAAKSYPPEKYSYFIKEKEEWLEFTFFPAISQWPSRQYSAKFNLNVAYPEAFHNGDDAGYYKPKPLLGLSQGTGPYYADYPKQPNFWAIDNDAPAIEDPYLEDYLKKIEDPNLRDRAENKL